MPLVNIIFCWEPRALAPDLKHLHEISHRKIGNQNKVIKYENIDHVLCCDCFRENFFYILTSTAVLIICQGYSNQCNTSFL
jgi:hypothetical protein